MNSPQPRAQTMSKNEFLRSMEEILRMPSSLLQGSELLRDAEDWDSAAILEFMAMVDCRLGVILDVESILSSETFDDLYSLIRP